MKACLSAYADVRCVLLPRSHRSGSNSPPTPSSIASCLRWSGALSVSAQSAYPQGPSQSAGGHALWPATQRGDFTPSVGRHRSSTIHGCIPLSPKSYSSWNRGRRLHGGQTSLTMVPQASSMSSSLAMEYKKFKRPFPPAVCAPPVPCHLAAHPPAPPSTLPSASAAAAGCRAAGAAGAARGDGCTRDERCLQRRVQTLWHMRRRCGGLLLGTVVQRETGAHACGRGARGHASREAITAASLGRYAAPGDAAGAPLDSRVPR